MKTVAVTGWGSHSRVALAMAEAPPTAAVAADSRRQSSFTVVTLASASMELKVASATKDSGWGTSTLLRPYALPLRRLKSRARPVRSAATPPSLSARLPAAPIPPIMGRGSYSATRMPSLPAATAAAMPAGEEPYTSTS